MTDWFEFYGVESGQMALDFQTYLRCKRDEPGTSQYFADVWGALPQGSTILRNGAGVGAGAEWFLNRGLRLIMAEPHDGMRAIMETKFAGNPNVKIIPDKFQSIELDQPVDGQEVRHLLYHLPDHEWGPAVMRAASMMSKQPYARLVVTLKCEFTHDQKMLREFRANKFKLLEQVLPHLYRRPEFSFRVDETNCIIVPEKPDDALAIARFMMCDRSASGFPGKIPYKQWEAYVLRHLAARDPMSPWQHNHTHICIFRNPYHELPCEA